MHYLISPVQDKSQWRSVAVKRTARVPGVARLACVGKFFCLSIFWKNCKRHRRSIARIASICLPAECVPVAAMALVCSYAGVSRGAVRELSNSVRRVVCGGRPPFLRTSYCTAGFIRCVQGHVRWWLSGEFQSLIAHAILVFGRPYAPLWTW